MGGIRRKKNWKKDQGNNWGLSKGESKSFAREKASITIQKGQKEDFKKTSRRNS